MLALLGRSPALSSALGYVSLFAWLGAQFPQLIENARLQSVDGLALPFLANWFFGDATNLIGCILTEQLPFQTMVATYFCFVDICLLIQFIYYSSPRFNPRLLSDSASVTSTASSDDADLFDVPTPPLEGSTKTIDATASQRRRSTSRRSRRRTRSVSQISQLENLVQIASAASTIAAAANAELTARGAADLVPLGSPPLGAIRSRSITRRDFALDEGGEAQDTVSGLASEQWANTASNEGVTSSPTSTTRLAYPPSASSIRERSASTSAYDDDTTDGAGPSNSSTRPSHKRNVSWGPEPAILTADERKRRRMSGHEASAPASMRVGMTAAGTGGGRQPLPHASVDAFWNDSPSHFLPASDDLERGRTRLRGQHDVPPSQPYSQTHSSTTPPLTYLPPSASQRTDLIISTSPTADRRHASGSSSHSHSPTARKSRMATAPVLFFGVWMLFSFGGSESPAVSRPSHHDGHAAHGVVLRSYDYPLESSGLESSSSSLLSSSSHSLSSPSLPSLSLSLSDPNSNSNSSTSIPSLIFTSSTPYHPVLYSSPSPSTFSSLGYGEHRLDRDDKDMKHVVGRISAWTCTTLYLTSRLPQIWKNYARKSVEGLTMSLFVCAFLGNFFYVASILTNPAMDERKEVAEAFLRESIPYILGSGGTLVFDVTIVAQSFLYKGRKPLVVDSHGHLRQSSILSGGGFGSGSGYLPPRSVGVGSLSGSTILGYGRGVSKSRTGTMSRSGTLGRRIARAGSISRQGTAAERVERERAPLLPVVQQQQQQKDYGASSDDSNTPTP